MKAYRRIIVTDMGNGGQFCGNCMKEITWADDICPNCKSELSNETDDPIDFGNHDPSRF